MPELWVGSDDHFLTGGEIIKFTSFVTLEFVIQSVHVAFCSNLGGKEPTN